MRFTEEFDDLDTSLFWNTEDPIMPFEYTVGNDPRETEVTQKKLNGVPLQTFSKIQGPLGALSYRNTTLPTKYILRLVFFTYLTILVCSAELLNQDTRLNRELLMTFPLIFPQSSLNVIEKTMADLNLLKIDESTKKKTLAKSLNNVYEDQSLKWIFVGGKGGVGKTTCSSSLALRLAQVRPSVLLISTDPAHNVSHAFDQKFGRAPTKVNGVENLFVMEMDPKGYLECLPGLCDGTCPERLSAKSALAEFFANIPGIDETLTYAEIMKMAHSLEFSVVVFDTAPTGHTLRLLSFPAALEAFFTKVIGLRDRFGPLLSIFQNFQGLDTGGLTDILDHLTDMLELIKKANEQLRNPKETTFVCVCTADFLSVYETEKLIQELCDSKIDCHNVVVNQLTVHQEVKTCKLCGPRRESQAKYLQQILDLYEDFNITEVPLASKEVRGVNELEEFSKLLIE
ncbi:hypothetical protein GE061_005442 [Apolygus lucorum]|uniref:ArsA/GET3 Anion-transporting ATPase-like domain-containing protein n=1 Tax=Apolygus lucorum TaxID=248454 RepID=A0A8S9X092_APOLU|nr:hypothetical protein GE061_005442 [Apolygus lucorum]